jgi:hypothetical protein
MVVASLVDNNNNNNHRKGLFSQLIHVQRKRYSSKIFTYFCNFYNIFSEMFIIMVNFLHIYKMVIVSSKAEKMVDSILFSNDKILLVSIRGWSGNILAVKARDSFRERFFGISELIGSSYSGSLTIATLSMVNEVKDIFGEAQAIITIYEDCKLMLLPMPSYEVIVGLAVERSVVTEDYSLANKIERILAGTIKS